PHILVESDLETIPMEWEQVDLPDDFGFAKVIDNHIFAATGGEIVRIETDLQTTETITVPGRVGRFDVAGDTIIVAPEPNWDTGCSEPETPTVVISYDGGDTWSDVVLPGDQQVGRFTLPRNATVATNEDTTLIATDVWPWPEGCLVVLAGIESDAYVGQITDDGVVFELFKGGTEVLAWSEMDLTDVEIAYLREATSGQAPPEATPIYRVDGTTALETSSVGRVVWSTGGRFAVFDWASGPPSSVRVSDDAAEWETINVSQNSWFSNSLHRGTGDGVEYSLDGGRSWTEVPRPPRSFEVTGYVELDGLTVANRGSTPSVSSQTSLLAFDHESGEWFDLAPPDAGSSTFSRVLGIVDQRIVVEAWGNFGPRLFVGRPV
ncbi:MAG: hypothetical protein GY708_25105, partial [Actinomycetia bacterium]|nr:hypothetical protein [Actinomycetes bacterium]